MNEALELIDESQLSYFLYLINNLPTGEELAIKNVSIRKVATGVFTVTHLNMSELDLSNIVKED